jgi:hypothetical protein
LCYGLGGDGGRGVVGFFLDPTFSNMALRSPFTDGLEFLVLYELCDLRVRFPTTRDFSSRLRFAGRLQTHLFPGATCDWLLG